MKQWRFLLLIGLLLLGMSFLLKEAPPSSTTKNLSLSGGLPGVSASPVNPSRTFLPPPAVHLSDGKEGEDPSAILEE